MKESWVPRGIYIPLRRRLTPSYNESIAKSSRLAKESSRSVFSCPESSVFAPVMGDPSLPPPPNARFLFGSSALDDSYRPLPSLYLAFLAIWAISALAWTISTWRNRFLQVRCLPFLVLFDRNGSVLSVSWSLSMVSNTDRCVLFPFCPFNRPSVLLVRAFAWQPKDFNFVCNSMCELAIV
ncbi:hypothetical protein BHM03_00019782 [Ensete ventricosum]|uniref:Uncharacterized protein n=1 Tax=Ensete ventricosum TaxID=4639 RepID=A0A445MFM4_ENSVE|nr:hypothetical protein BHM03_00019782 [Ensete ventricosum]